MVIGQDQTIRRYKTGAAILQAHRGEAYPIQPRLIQFQGWVRERSGRLQEVSGWVPERSPRWRESSEQFRETSERSPERSRRLREVWERVRLLADLAQPVSAVSGCWLRA